MVPNLIDFLKTVKGIIFTKRVFFSIVFLYVILEILYVVKYADEILVSDPGWYVYYAEECVKHGTMYPDYSNYHDEYIFAPGWVNFIILGIKLLGGGKLASIG